jgi:hypothetical protein
MATPNFTSFQTLAGFFRLEIGSRRVAIVATFFLFRVYLSEFWTVQFSMDRAKK